MRAFLGRCNWWWHNPALPMAKTLIPSTATYRAQKPHAAHPLSPLSEAGVLCRWPACSDPRNRTEPQGEVRSRVAMPTNSPEAGDQSFGGADSVWNTEHADSYPEDIWQANQVALFKICSCPCQSTGPSLPHPHSEMNSYCSGSPHFQQPPLAQKQAPQKQAPASLSPGASVSRHKRRLGEKAPVSTHNCTSFVLCTLV